MYNLIAEGESAASSVIDTSALTNTLTTETFGGIIESVLPIIAVAVIVGFLVFAVRWAIRLFRGV